MASPDELGEVEKGAKITAIERATADPSVLLKQVGALMVAESMTAFRDQQLGSEAWKARKSPNVFGILADLADGKRDIPARRFEARPALIDTGRLRSSIAWRVMAGGDVVEVGTNLPYAVKLHRGGDVESRQITSDMQSALWSWLKGPGKAHKKKLGWLLNRKFTGKKLKATLPARPIVGITTETIAAVRELVGVSIAEAK